MPNVMVALPNIGSALCSTPLFVARTPSEEARSLGRRSNVENAPHRRHPLFNARKKDRRLEMWANAQRDGRPAKYR